MMNSPDAHDENELLWEVGSKVADESSVDLPDQALIAYREGRLAKEEARAHERDLGRSTQARARLAELATCGSAPPAPHVRGAVLAGFDASFQRRPELEPARGPVSGSLLKAAAIAVVGLGMLMLMRLPFAAPPPQPLPAAVAYDVAAEGLATRRQSVPGGREIEAYPETRIRITASPRAAAVKSIEFGVYRETAERLVRLELGSGLEIETIRGAAVVTGPARALAAPGPGSTRLFLVAARPGDLPAKVEIGAEAPAHAAPGAAAVEALEEAGRRRAYPVVIHLRPRPAAH
jgi:hypothetical protein